jgi:hypothetical protein
LAAKISENNGSIGVAIFMAVAPITATYISAITRIFKPPACFTSVEIRGEITVITALEHFPLYAIYRG